MASGHKKFVFITSFIVIFLIVGTSYFLFHNRKLVNNNLTTPSSSFKEEELNLSPTSRVGTQKLSILLAQYKDYTIKAGSVYVNDKLLTKTNKYQNSNLKISFLYPKNLYFKAGVEPTRPYRPQPNLTMAMTDLPNSKSLPEDPWTEKDYIDDNIKCRIDPSPEGICVEGIAPWLDISITETSDIQEFNQAREVENLGQFKAISSQSLNLDGSDTNFYRVLYPINNKNIIINFISTTNLAENKDYSYAIWLLLNSFKAY